MIDVRDLNIVNAGYVDYWNLRWDNPKAGNGSATFGHLGMLYRRLVDGTIKAHDIQDMLDVGCGAGNQWYGTQPVPEARYTGLEISGRAIGYARKKFPGANFRRGDITEPWSWIDLAADLVTCTDVLIHIKPEDYPGVVERIFDAARKFAIIRMWTNPKKNGLLGYHWSHEPPVTGDYTGWQIVPLKEPNKDGWVTYICRRENA